MNGEWNVALALLSFVKKIYTPFTFNFDHLYLFNCIVYRRVFFKKMKKVNKNGNQLTLTIENLISDFHNDHSISCAFTAHKKFYSVV